MITPAAICLPPTNSDIFGTASANTASNKNPVIWETVPGGYITQVCCFPVINTETNSQYFTVSDLCTFHF